MIDFSNSPTFVIRTSDRETHKSARAKAEGNDEKPTTKIIRSMALRVCQPKTGSYVQPDSTKVSASAAGKRNQLQVKLL